MPEFYDAKKIKDQFETFSDLLTQIENSSEKALTSGPGTAAENGDLLKALRAALQVLRRGLQRYVSFLETTHEGIWVLNEDLITTFVNDQVCEMIGRSAEEIIGHSPIEFTCKAQQEALAIRLQHRKKARAKNYNLCLNHADGSAVAATISATPLMDADGTFKGVLALVRNITAHKQMESDASAIRSQLHETLEAMPDSFHLLSPDLRILYVNPGAVKLFGRPAQELLNQKVDELFPPTAELDYPAVMRQAMQTGVTAQYDTYYEPFGRWFEVRAHPVPQGLAVYARDTTVEKEALRHKDAILDGIAAQVALLDDRGKIIEVNKSWADYTGANGLPGGGVGLNYLELLAMAGMPVEDISEKLGAVMAGTSARYIREHRCVHNGKETWWRFSGTPAPRADGHGGAVVVHSDITEAKVVEAALARSEERYALAAEGANDGLFEWDMTRKHMYFSPRWKEILGYQPDELTGDRVEWMDRIHPDDQELLRLEMWRSRSQEKPKLNTEFRIRRKDGSYCWVLCRAILMFHADGLPARIVGSISDITERKSYEDRLAHFAMHDPLTGLPNRLLLTERLERAMEHFVRKSSRRYAVLFLDLDNFKHVNDSLGHQVGDQLLIEVGNRIRKCLKRQDTVARLGGDEFAILLEEIAGDSAAIVATKRIQEALSKPFTADAKAISVTASVGVFIGSPGHTSPVEVLRDADTAMYKAKAAGRNAYAIFDAKMHQDAVARLELENDLYKAIESDQFLVYYQPIFEIQSMRPCGFEALVRWQHPEKGLVPPSEFIPMAEETGQIIAIGEWVARTACRAYKQWQQDFPVLNTLETRMSINVSARQFAAANFSDRITEILLQEGTACTDINLELTESALLINPTESEKLLERLREMGFKIHLDDFGTGFSSLTHLQLPIDSVKIDRRFVSNICCNNRDRELVRGIINLAAALNLGVVAEGVETKDQARELLNLNCHAAQGYYYSRPLPEEEIRHLLASL